MGGFAFTSPDGSPVTTSIKKAEVNPTLEDFRVNVLKKVGIESYNPIGSTGKKEVSGDLDIVVGPFPVDDSAEMKKIKDRLFTGIQEIVGSGSVKKVGANLAVMYPISGRPMENVQIDLMFSKDPQKTSWLMAGTGDGKIKGVYRNLLLSYIAKLASEKSDGLKITLSMPGGIMVKRGDEVILQRTEDASEIIRVLDLPTNENDIQDFESLVDVLLRTSKYKNDLAGFRDYISRYLQAPGTKQEAQKAIKYLEDKLGIKETRQNLRRLIREMIRS